MRCKGCKKKITKFHREYGFHLIFNGKNYHNFCLPDEPGLIVSPSLERMMEKGPSFFESARIELIQDEEDL